MPSATAPAEHRVLLRNISWDTYERLLAEVVNVAGTRITYDDGNLEILVAGLATKGRIAPSRHWSGSLPKKPNAISRPPGQRLSYAKT